MSEKIKWDVWGHTIVLEAESAEAAIAEYRRRVASGRVASWDGGVPVEARAHNSTENAETLRRQRDEYKRKYEEEVSKNREAREALDKIHETLEDISIYDRDN